MCGRKTKLSHCQKELHEKIRKLDKNVEDIENKIKSETKNAKFSRFLKSKIRVIFGRAPQPFIEDNLLIPMLQNRKDISRILAECFSDLSHEFVSTIHKIDGRLRNINLEIRESINYSTKSRDIKELLGEEWWNLDKPEMNSSGWFFEFLAIAFTAATTILFANYVLRYTCNGTEIDFPITLLAQGLVPLLPAAAFTGQGRKLIKKALISFGLEKESWDDAVFALSFIAFIVMISLTSMMPHQSRIYLEQGREIVLSYEFPEYIGQEQRNIADAEILLKRSLYFQANNAEVNYWLGRLFYDKSDYQKSIVEFSNSISSMSTKKMTCTASPQAVESCQVHLDLAKSYIKKAVDEPIKYDLAIAELRGAKNLLNRSKSNKEMMRSKQTNYDMEKFQYDIALYKGEAELLKSLQERSKSAQPSNFAPAEAALNDAIYIDSSGEQDSTRLPTGKEEDIKSEDKKREDEIRYPVASCVLFEVKLKLFPKENHLPILKTCQTVNENKGSDSNSIYASASSAKDFDEYLYWKDRAEGAHYESVIYSPKKTPSVRMNQDSQSKDLVKLPENGKITRRVIGK
jgi:hypothetical protein